MRGLAPTALGVVVLTMLAAAVGGWIGVRYGMHEAKRSPPTLDEVVHQGLHLTSAQQQRIAALEAAFAKRQATLEDEMRAADRDLAQAIVAEHRYGPRAQQAIDRFHAAMKALQQETVIHVLAMREVLTPEQAKRFDETVMQVLASGQL